MLAPPRIWENMLTLMQIKGSDASPMKRRVFEHFRGLAERCELKRSDGKSLSLGDRARPGAGRDLRLRPGARPARPAQGALVLHRRRAAGARHLSLLPLLRHQPQAGLRRHRGVGADRLPGRCRGQSQHRGPADPAHRNQDRRSRRGAAEGLQRLQGLLQAGRGDARHHHVGRLAEDRRCRLLRQAGPPGHHRPRQGRREAFRRLGLRAAVHREQAEVQPVHPRGRGVRRPAAVRRRHDRHRHADRRHLGGEAGARLHELHGPQQQARGRRHDRRGDRQGQCDAARRAAGQALPAAEQGARRRRRRDDAHPQGPPPLRRREVRQRHRRLLRRRLVGRRHHGDHLRGRPQVDAELDHRHPRQHAEPPSRHGRRHRRCPKTSNSSSPSC